MGKHMRASTYHRVASLVRRARSVVRAGGLVSKMWGGGCHVVLANLQSWENTVVSL